MLSSHEHLSESELREHYHTTAPIEDVRFALRVNIVMPHALREEWESLYNDVCVLKMKRREVYRRLENLLDTWRLWRNDQEAQEHAE